MFPVVQTGSLDLPLIEREAKRFDQVQFGARRQACSAGVAGVPMDLRMNKNNVCRCGSGFCFLRNLEAPLKARRSSKVGSRLSKPSNDSHHAGKADSSAFGHMRQHICGEPASQFLSNLLPGYSALLSFGV